MAKTRRLFLCLAVLFFCAHGVANAASASSPGRLTPEENSQTVYDSALNVTWLADGDLAASQTFGVTGINAGGSMNYHVAVKWVAAMNAQAYLGHTDWTIAATPKTDPTCRKTGPNANSFGFDCHNSSLGSLYYVGLGLTEPNTAVPMPPSTTAGFRNFQPYLYWTGTPNQHVGTNPSANKNGYGSFSLNSGFKGGNVSPNYLYALPMIPAGKVLKVAIPPGQTVADPTTGTIWLADADLAATNNFGVAGINKDGAMQQTTAVAWVKAMNAYNGGKGYLGQNHWQLPNVVDSDPGCSMKTFGFGCTASPLGQLYYGLLGKKAGESVVATPDTKVGPFHNVQPYLYWSCLADSGKSTCSTDPAADNFQFSFSLGNGFQGTDFLENDLYVMVYYPGPPAGVRATSPAPVTISAPVCKPKICK